MPNPIKPKRSFTASNTPSLLSGELGINAADGKMWIGNAAGTANVLISSLALSDHTGTLGVANGGTGATTLTANNVILGNGTSAPTFVAPGTSGNLLTSNGTTWQSTAPAASAAVPTGSLFPYAGSTAPTGYLLCDGSSISSTNYLALHAVISNTYGGSAYTGAAGISFNLPDLKGRMPIGSMGTGSGLTARVTGTKYGTETHTVSSSNIQSFSSGNAGSHSHTLNKEVLTYMGSGGNRYDPYPGSVWAGSPAAGLTISTAADHSHTIGTASPTGINHINPCLGINYIIKT